MTPANRLTWHHDLDGRSSGNPFQLALDPEEASHIPCPKVIEIDDSEAESINELEVGSEGASLTEKSRSTSRSNTLLPDSPTPERMWGSGHLNLLDDGRNYLEDEAFHGLDLARLDHDSPFTSIHTHLPPPPALLPPKVSTRKRRRSEKSYPSRRTPLDLEGFVEHRDFFEFNDIQFFPGCDVEIEGNEFMRVKVILLDHEHDEVSVRGHLFRSVPILEGMLERKRSEIFWVVEAAQGDPRSHSDQAMQTKRIELVIRRKEIILTNTNYPRFSQDGRLVCRWKYLTIYQPPRTPRRMNVIEHALIRLTEDEADKSFNQRDMALRRIWLGRKTDGGSGSGCTLEEREHRQKEEQLAKDAAKWVPKHPLPESMANMILSSGRRSNRMTPISIADYSRGLAASISPRDLIPSSPVIDLTGEAGTSDLVSNLHEVIIIGDDDEDEEEGNAPPGRDLSGSEHEVKIDEFWDSQITRASSIARVSPNGLNNMRRYTFGDAFSGCGGTSRGALMAGLQLDWSFDHDSRACQSYRKSFPATRIANTDVHNFTTDDRYGCPVDILHISPPCQYFSPAHTINGPQDESNVAANFSLLELIKKIRSRIITLENTAGLPTRHKDYLLPLIQQFTTHGYSIRWRTVNLVNYGIPQDRRRFLIIASWYVLCPRNPSPADQPSVLVKHFQDSLHQRIPPIYQRLVSGH